HQHPGLVGQHTSIPGWSASTPASQAGRQAHQHPRLVGQHSASQAGRPADQQPAPTVMLDQHITIPGWSASTPATST
ncbi:uncharacterized, partial [Tachysurus ichikawai]